MKNGCIFNLNFFKIYVRIKSVNFVTRMDPDEIIPANDRSAPLRSNDFFIGCKRFG